MSQEKSHLKKWQKRYFCLSYLIFILLNLNNVCAASSFEDVLKKIQKKEFCHLGYNFSKTAAVVSVDCNSAIYIDFKTRKIQVIVKHWPNVFPVWKSDTIVHVKGSCGTGCSQSII